MSERLEKYYRFVLLGVSGSGKTCYLAALALGRGCPEREMACTKIPPDASINNESQSDFEALLRGDQLIGNASQKIVDGLVPDATDLSTLNDGVLPAIEFSVSTANRSSIRIRTVDYAGELILSDGYKDVDSSASKLKKIFHEFDGLLILTDVPNAESPFLSQRQEEEIKNLTQVFTALSESKDKALNQLPVALVLSKWDQWSGYNRDVNISPVPEIEKLLSTYRGFQLLFSSIYLSLGDQPKSTEPSQASGYYKGNSGVFVTAAFEVDKENNPIRNNFSYGMIDPLVWLVERRDLLDTVQMESDWTSKPHNMVLPWKSGDVGRRASKLMKRMSRASDPWKRVRNIRNKAMLSACCSTITIGMFMTGSFATGNGLYLRSKLNSVQNKIVKPETTYEDLIALETEVEGLGKKRPFAILSPSTKSVNETLLKLRNMRDEVLYRPYENAKADLDKYNAAKKYVEKIPNGLKAKDCIAFIQGYEQRIGEGENRRYIEEITKLADQAIRAKNELQLKDVISQILIGFPKREFVSQSEIDDLANIEKGLQTELSVLTAAKNWDDFEKNYQETFISFDPVQASGLLIARNPRDENWTNLAKSHASKIVEWIQNEKEKVLINHEFSRFLESIGKAKQGLSDFEFKMRSSESAMADLQLEGQKKLSQVEDEIKLAYDNYLYQTVIDHKSAYSCDAYLSKSPLKKRTEAVEKYKAYLDWFKKEQNILIQFRVKWDSKYDYGNENKLTILWNNSKITLPEGYIEFKKGTISNPIGTFNEKVSSFDEDILIEGTIVEEDPYIPYLSNYDDGGKGKKQIRVRDLLGKTVAIPLKITGTEIQNELLLDLVPSSVPTAPTLPGIDS